LFVGEGFGRIFVVNEFLHFRFAVSSGISDPAGPHRFEKK
jgi:hypothetical protein